MEKNENRKVKIKMLKAEPRYGLRRNDCVELEIVERKTRTTIFFEPPLRYLEIFNEDFKKLPVIK